MGKIFHKMIHFSNCSPYFLDFWHTSYRFESIQSENTRIGRTQIFLFPVWNGFYAVSWANTTNNLEKRISLVQYFAYRKVITPEGASKKEFKRNIPTQHNLITAIKNNYGKERAHHWTVIMPKISEIESDIESLTRVDSQVRNKILHQFHLKRNYTKYESSDLTRIIRLKFCSFKVTWPSYSKSWKNIFKILKSIILIHLGSHMRAVKI